jgi:small-conductance mechanosensitive channel
LRVWINDPKNGIGSVRSAVLSAVGDAFRSSGIEFPYPQRDLHIKDAVSLKINLLEKAAIGGAESEGLS